MPAEPAAWLWCRDDGCVLRLRVRPGASRAGVAGVHGDALAVRVTSPPVDGAANHELLDLLAGVLRVRRRDLVLETGSTGRQKRVRVRGLSVEDVRARLTAVLSVDSAGEHN